MNFSDVLSEGQVERVHAEAERLLAETGIKVLDEDLLRRCREAGCAVEPHSGAVRVPKPLLRELIGRAPRTYAIRGIGGRAFEVGGAQPWGVAIVTDPWIVDYETQRPRRPRLEDLRRHTIIAEQMDGVAAISRMDFPVEDVPGPASSLRALEMHLLHTTKHYYFPSASPESNGMWMDLMRILADGNDATQARLFSVMVAVISPLVFSSVNADLLRLAAEYNAPVMPTVCPMAGSTSPYTPGGTLLLGHAENLAAAALTQILCPGHPFLYAFGPSVTDLRTGHDLYYTLDKVLWKAAGVQLAKHVHLPAAAECGGTMTFRSDPQNGAEGMLFMLSAVASGADILAGFGSCYCGVGMSAEMMLIQEAWLGAARHLMRGIDTSERLLASDRLREAGPGGAFLTDPLTLELMRGDGFFKHPLFDRSPAEQEGRGMLERAHERVEEIVSRAVSPVPASIQEQLRRYFHDTCKKLECA